MQPVPDPEGEGTEGRSWETVGMTDSRQAERPGPRVVQGLRRPTPPSNPCPDGQVVEPRIPLSEIVVTRAELNALGDRVGPDWQRLQ